MKRTNEEFTTEQICAKECYQKSEAIFLCRNEQSKWINKMKWNTLLLLSLTDMHTYTFGRIPANLCGCDKAVPKEKQCFTHFEEGEQKNT